jgi:hypothetical protein
MSLRATTAFGPSAAIVLVLTLDGARARWRLDSFTT